MSFLGQDYLARYTVITELIKFKDQNTLETFSVELITGYGTEYYGDY
jgi:hypothetical protein